MPSRLQCYHVMFQIPNMTRKTPLYHAICMQAVNSHKWTRLAVLANHPLVLICLLLQCRRFHVMPCPSSSVLQFALPSSKQASATAAPSSELSLAPARLMVPALAPTDERSASM